MFHLFRKKRNKKPANISWLHWLAVAFIIYAVISNNLKQKDVVEKPVEKPSAAIEQTQVETEKLPVIEADKIINIGILQSRLTPKSVRKLYVEDIAEGKGDISICAQRVTIDYSAFTEDGNKIEEVKNLSFQIGKAEVMPALEKGIIGMKKGGTRNIFTPNNIAYGDTKFKKDGINLPEFAQLRIETKLLNIEPEQLPNSEAYHVIGGGSARDAAYSCGSQAKIHLSIWDTEGKKLYSSKDKQYNEDENPITFTIGKDEVFVGLEQGVIGMEEKMTRVLVVPPNFQKTLHGGIPKINFPLPEKQTILVYIDAIP